MWLRPIRSTSLMTSTAMSPLKSPTCQPTQPSPQASTHKSHRWRCLHVALRFVPVSDFVSGETSPLRGDGQHEASRDSRQNATTDGDIGSATSVMWVTEAAHRVSPGTTKASTTLD